MWSRSGWRRESLTGPQTLQPGRCSTTALPYGAWRPRNLIAGAGTPPQKAHGLGPPDDPATPPIGCPAGHWCRWEEHPGPYAVLDPAPVPANPSGNPLPSHQSAVLAPDSCPGTTAPARSKRPPPVKGARLPTLKEVLNQSALSWITVRQGGLVRRQHPHSPHRPRSGITPGKPPVQDALGASPPPAGRVRCPKR